MTLPLLSVSKLQGYSAYLGAIPPSFVAHTLADLPCTTSKEAKDTLHYHAHWNDRFSGDYHYQGVVESMGTLWPQFPGSTSLLHITDSTSVGICKENSRDSSLLVNFMLLPISSQTRSLLAHSDSPSQDPDYWTTQPKRVYCLYLHEKQPILSHGNLLGCHKRNISSLERIQSARINVAFRRACVCLSCYLSCSAQCSPHRLWQN